ncbi:SurA N-terminal domain-containing protein [Candidatus Desantisbacteria bacterium]|nr:SurA N-terminal domain-containing protein [Candidatus Desantisbacteria bacterium]
MKNKLKASLVLFFSIFLLMSCKTSEKKDDNSAANANIAEGDIVAKVGNTIISKDDFERKFLSVPPQFKMFFNGEDGKKRFLEQIIKEKMFIEQAVRLGVDKKKEIQQNLSDMKDNLIANELYNSKMKEFENTSNISDQDVENEIKSNKIARASHILIKDETKAKNVFKRVKKGEDITKLSKEFSKSG